MYDGISLFFMEKVKMRDNAFRKEIAKGIIAAMFYDIYNFAASTCLRMRFALRAGRKSF